MVPGINSGSAKGSVPVQGAVVTFEEIFGIFCRKWPNMGGLCFQKAFFAGRRDKFGFFSSVPVPVKR